MDTGDGIVCMRYGVPFPVGVVVPIPPTLSPLNPLTEKRMREMVDGVVKAPKIRKKRKKLK